MHTFCFLLYGWYFIPRSLEARHRCIHIGSAKGFPFETLLTPFSCLTTHPVSDDISAAPAACPTPHGHTVNCAPVHRYPASCVPEIRTWLQHLSEIARHSLSCIAMQPCRNHLGRFSGFAPGKGTGNGLDASETR